MITEAAAAVVVRKKGWKMPRSYKDILAIVPCVRASSEQKKLKAVRNDFVVFRDCWNGSSKRQQKKCCLF